MANECDSPRFPRAGRGSVAFVPCDQIFPGLVSSILNEKSNCTESTSNKVGDDKPTLNSQSGWKESGLLDVYGEGLGADFRETPWKKPSKALAAEFRASTMYGGGKAAIWGRSDTSLFQMGEGISRRFSPTVRTTFGFNLLLAGVLRSPQTQVGVGLYFIYIRRMLIFSVIATVLTLPHLFMCFFGGSLTRAEMDPMRLLTLSAGNHRLANASDTSSSSFHPCEGGGNETVQTLFLEDSATCDDQFLKMFNDPEVLLTAKNGSYVITVLDVLCCIIFMMLYWKFLSEISGFKERANKENVTPADYSVEVRGIPEDTADEEVIDHFSELFRLDKPGWTYPGWSCFKLGKKTADMPKDVTDCAGVSIGENLKPVESTEHSRFDHICQGTWLAECSLAHPDGDFIRQSKKLTSMHEKILETRARVKKVRFAPKSKLRRRRLRLVEDQLGNLRNALERGARELRSRAQTFELFSWKTTSAYVVFNHEASVTRCLADYARYPLWMQPPRLRFRGVYRIKVQQAPEAGNILWENLELTSRQRRRRTTLTLWVTIVLLGVSFGILYASNMAEMNFYSASEKIEERCQVTIPAEHGLPPTTPFIGNLQAGDICKPNEIWVTLQGSSYQATGQENACVEPCVNTFDSADIDCGGGVSFSPSEIATCLCRQKIGDHGTEAIKFVRLAGGGCWSYGTKYVLGTMLTIVASANVVIINFGLKHTLKRMGVFERHPSVTELAVSNTWKIALALFINSACVVLLVNFPASRSTFGSSRTVARSITEDAHNSEWYTVTGQALITTIAINVFAPRGPDLAEYFVLGPWRRRASSAEVAITQKQLNKSWEGRNFDLSSRLPITLMMMAVAITFSPALPVLFPMVSAYLLCTYLGDKFHLLRVCRTPPQYDGRIVKIAVHAMPWILLGHCLFALFTFWGDEFFASSTFSDVLSPSNKEDFGVDTGTTQSVSRSSKLICLPYVIAPILLAAYGLFTSTIGKLLYLSWSIVTCKCFRGSSKVHGPKIRVTNPPYTEIFERGYPPRDPVPSFYGRDMGWIVREDERGCHLLYKEKPETGLSPNSTRSDASSKPDLMLTWEVLRSIYPTHTFHMEDSSAYSDIMITRNVLAKELRITTPKSPGGKLWSPADYLSYVSQTKASSPRNAQWAGSPKNSPR